MHLPCRPLGSFSERAAAKSELRTQIRLSHAHPAITAWLVGNEANGPWQQYVCTREYARTVDACPGVDPAVPRCEFDDDAAALMRVLDELCGVVGEYGLPCSAPLAGVSLPRTGAHFALPQYRDGALGWLMLMDGSDEDHTLHHMDMWSLNLYPGRTFDNYVFDEYAKVAGGLPVLVTEYGVDAFNTDAWYKRCGGFLLTDEDRSACTTEQTEPGALATFADEAMQADWVLTLTESLARQPVVSGGAVLGWIDEYWKGRVIDSDEVDVRSSAMACPDAFADRHTSCGYPSASGQPDRFVNEEWFGLFSLVGQCEKSQIDQIKPRAAWFGLKALWTTGGCRGAHSASFDEVEYPRCAPWTVSVRELWQRGGQKWLQANASARAAIAATGTPAAVWTAQVGARVEAVAAHGDGDCEIQQLIHDFDPTLCPAAPTALVDWVNTTLASYGSRTDLLFPSVCEDNQLVNGLADGEFSLILVAGVLLLGLFVGNWERILLCRRRSSKVRRIVKTARGAQHQVLEEAVRCGGKAIGTTKALTTNAVNMTMARLPVSTVNTVNTMAGSRRNMSLAGSRDKCTRTPLTTCASSVAEDAEEGAEDAESQGVPTPRPRLSLMIVRDGSCSGPAGFGGLSGEGDHAELVEVVAARALLLPVAQRLASLFGFQTKHDGTASNVANTVESLAALLGATLQRLPAASVESHLAIAVARVHATNTTNYTRWMARLGLRPRAKPTSESAQLQQLVLWYLIWGEAANLRHLPECLCLILYCASNALAFEASSSPSSRGEEASSPRESRISFEAGFEEVTFAPQLPPRYKEEGRASVFPHVVSLPVFFTPVGGGTGGVVQYRPGDYLACLVSPIYRVLQLEIQHRAKPTADSSAALADRTMYDDANEFFWSRANIDALIIRTPTTSEPAAVERVESHLGYAALRARLGGGEAAKGAEVFRALLRKTFSERPSWLAALYGFRRVLLLNGVALHAMLVGAFANVLCEYDAAAAVPDFTLKAERDAAEAACIASKCGDNHWKLTLTLALTLTRT